MEERFISNGQTYSEFFGTHVPPGCHLISKEEFVEAMRVQAAGHARHAELIAEKAREAKAVIKKKLMTGKPLTEAEADLLLS